MSGCLNALGPDVTVRAQRVPTQHYDVGSGLVSNDVRAIYQDTKGYLWFGGTDGLSRFDGYRFVNYGVDDGLPSRIITSIVEDSQGRLWIGTFGAGLARLIDDPREAPSQKQDAPRVDNKKFITYQIGSSDNSNHVTALVAGRDGSLWFFSDGLYRGTLDAGGTPRFDLVVNYTQVDSSGSLADSRGRLWFGVRHALIQVIDGRIVKYDLPGEAVNEGVTNIVEDASRTLLVATAHNVYRFVPHELPNEGRAQWTKIPLSISPGRIFTMATDAVGNLWIGTGTGLISYANGKQSRPVGSELDRRGITRIYRDTSGNLWISSSPRGVYRLYGDSIKSFVVEDSALNANLLMVFEDPDGPIYVSTERGGVFEVVDGRVLQVPGSGSSLFRDIRKKILRDRRGDWWVGTNEALYRFWGPKLQFRHGQRFTEKDGLTSPQGGNYGLYEDFEGRIWVARPGNELYVYNPRRGGHPRFERITYSEPALGGVMHMANDLGGGLWIASYGALGRLLNGKTFFFQPLGDSATLARTLFLDSRGRLWIGSRYNGALMVSDPTAETPTFQRYSTREGLSSNSIWSFAEDDSGRIYVGTSRGLDRLDPASGRVRHFTDADGLPETIVNHCFRDRRGDIWIAAVGGLFRLHPRVEQQLAPARAYISRLQIAGSDVALPERGTLRIAVPELNASNNNLLIEYVGLNFQREGALRYQYRLDGVDQNWSIPTEDRTITYARLGAGTYRFLVRTVTANNLTGEPAVVEFRILPPIWQRWWFITLAAALVALAAYSLYRYRVQRLLDLERVRTRIATDLHDDIGSNLSLIAMISDLAKRQLDPRDSQVSRWLSMIASTSRETVDSMSDIVWVINPEKDRLIDLVQRMRQVANDMLTARDIAFDLDAPGEQVSIRLGASTRREVFLTFKESINNLVRHSECTRAEIELKVEGNWLLLKVTDNGKGFDPVNVREGNGLASMRRRSDGLHGEFQINSSPESGTSLIVRVPVDGNPAI
ncbi:MAG: ligand-binding sensor domain-containing protein [Acidobacteriota bacterium]